MVAHLNYTDTRSIIMRPKRAAAGDPLFALFHLLEPLAVAVSFYGWLMTDCGWLAG